MNMTMPEIAKLLKENPGLKLYVVGHTDNTGTEGKALNRRVELMKQ